MLDFNCGIDGDIYDIIQGKHETLVKVKICNADIDVIRMTVLINKLSMLKIIIFIDTHFIYNSINYTDEKTHKELFNELITSIAKTKIEKVSISKYNKYLSQSSTLSSFELSQLLSLLSYSTPLTQLTIHDIKNQISNDSISLKEFNTENVSNYNNNNRLNLLFNFNSFTLFHLLKIKHFEIINIGPMDRNSFNSLISHLLNVRSVKTLICRFNTDFKPQLKDFDFLLNDKLHFKTVHMYNITIESFEDLLSILYLNYSIQEFVLCSFHSVINYQNKAVDHVGTLNPPFYYTYNIRQLLCVLYAIKTKTKKIYHSKKLVLDLISYIQIPRTKRIYIENKVNCFQLNYEFENASSSFKVKNN